MLSRTKRNNGARVGNHATLTVWATPEQWDAVARLATLANWTEGDLGKRAGFGKDGWRDFYGRLKALGLLVPRGNGPQAGYRPHPYLLQILERRPWRRD